MTCRSHFHIFHAFFCTEFQAGHLQSTRSFALSVLRRCLCTREAMWKNTDWKSYISANVDVSLHIHSKPTSRNHVPLPCSGIFVHLPKSALTSDLTIGKRPAIGSGHLQSSCPQRSPLCAGIPIETLARGQHGSEKLQKLWLYAVGFRV